MRSLRLFLAALATLACAAVAAAQNDTGLSVPDGFSIERVARINAVRELAFAPDGNLFAGTRSGQIYVVPHPEQTPGEPAVYVKIGDPPAATVYFSGDTLYAGTQHGIWKVPYSRGALSASGEPVKIASVRPGNGRDHMTTSLAVAGNHLYASVGSSCNACVETDPTRATIEELNLDGSDMHAKAVRIRNAIALAVNPQTGTLWAGVAGQDELEHGHPYEIFDAITLRKGTIDYLWPDCYDDRKPAKPGADCAALPLPRVVLPAYATPIGAVFYPLHEHGRHAFPGGYRGGAFIALHGSWHVPLVPPRVAFVPMHGDEPLSGVDWNNPDAQWHEFVGGFQNAIGYRSGRPTGIAVGPEGSLFVADDYGNAIYRIRPR
jgi:glucose/arabinose dehydrogenase